MDFCYEPRSELYHHGILGQKWGIRRFQNEDGTWTAAGLRRKARLERLGIRESIKTAKAQARADKKISAINSRKRLKDMSDDEIKARISRLNLEKQYKDLSQDVKGISRGREFLNRILDLSDKKMTYETRVKELAIKKQELSVRTREALAKASQAKSQAKQSRYNAKQADKQAKQARNQYLRDKVNKRINLIMKRNERRKLKLMKKVKAADKDKYNKYLNGELSIDEVLGLSKKKDKDKDD